MLLEMCCSTTPKQDAVAALQSVAQTLELEALGVTKPRIPNAQSAVDVSLYLG